MEKDIKCRCQNCEVEYTIFYDPVDGKPVVCPFCGDDITEVDDEAGEDLSGLDDGDWASEE